MSSLGGELGMGIVAWGFVVVRYVTLGIMSSGIITCNGLSDRVKHKYFFTFNRFHLLFVFLKLERMLLIAFYFDFKYTSQVQVMNSNFVNFILHPNFRFFEMTNIHPVEVLLIFHASKNCKLFNTSKIFKFQKLRNF